MNKIYIVYIVGKNGSRKISNKAFKSQKKAVDYMNTIDFIGCEKVVRKQCIEVEIIE